MLTNKPHTTGTHYRVSAIANGIKKRARNHKRHSFDLGYMGFTDLSEDETERLKDTAREKLRAEMRDTTTAYVRLDKVTVDEICEKWEPFSDENKVLAL